MAESTPLPLLDELRAFFATVALTGSFALWRFDWDLVEETGPQGEPAVRVFCRALPPGWSGSEDRRPAAAFLLPLHGLESLRAEHGVEGLHAFLAGNAHQVLPKLVLFLLDESLTVGGEALWSAKALSAQAEAKAQRVQRARLALVDSNGNRLN